MPNGLKLLPAALIASGTLLLAVGLVYPASSQDKEGLEITGIADRSSIRAGDSINLLVQIANSGPDAVKIISVKPLFGSDEPCNLSDSLVPRDQTTTATCQQLFQKEGKYNGGVDVVWEPVTKGGKPQRTAKTLFQLGVSPAPWYASLDARWYQGIAALLLLVSLLAGLLALVSRRSQSQKLFRTFLFGSILITLYGLIADNGTVVVAGLLSTLVAGALTLGGKEFLTNLMDRITKAGPFEFSPLSVKAQDLQIFKLREQDFLQAETTIDEILALGDKLQFYIEFLRVKSYALETKLIAKNPLQPPTDEAIGTRIDWLMGISWDYDLKPLRELYADIRRHERLRDLFDADLEKTLRNAKKLDDEARDQVILQVIAKLESDRSAILIPQYFTVLARLWRILKQKEKALSILYEGHDRFPDSINTNVLLGWHIGETNGNYSAALKYECRALEIAVQCAADLKTWYDRVEKAEPDNGFARYLKSMARAHKTEWHGKMTAWFTGLEMEMRNNVAFDIAVEGVLPLEPRARKDAEIAHKHDSENASYCETLGMVRLRFANSLTGGKENDVKEALRLFERAIYMAPSQKDTVTLRMAQLHYEEARETLRRM